MKNILFYFLILLSILSCSKESPFISKEEYDAFIESKKLKLNNISFIYDSDIYYITDLIKGEVEQITFSPEVDKKDIRMSVNAQKFAYLNSDSIIEIVNRDGELIDRLTQYKSIQDFDWSYDNQTLYILSNNELFFYGETMNVPDLTLPRTIHGYNMQITNVSISTSGDLAYIVKAVNYYATGNFPVYGFVMITKPNDGSDTAYIYNKTHQNFGRHDELRNVRFSKNRNDLTLEYGSNTDDKDYELFEDLNQYPLQTIKSTGTYANVLFRGDINYVLACYKGADENDFIIKAKHILDNSEQYELDQYKGISSPLSIDWK